MGTENSFFLMVGGWVWGCGGGGGGVVIHDPDASFTDLFAPFNR